MMSKYTSGDEEGASRRGPRAVVHHRRPRNRTVPGCLGSRHSNEDNWAGAERPAIRNARWPLGASAPSGRPCGTYPLARPRSKARAELVGSHTVDETRVPQGLGQAHVRQRAPRWSGLLQFASTESRGNAISSPLLRRYQARSLWRASARRAAGFRGIWGMAIRLAGKVGPSSESRSIGDRSGGLRFSSANQAHKYTPVAPSSLALDRSCTPPC